MAEERHYRIELDGRNRPTGFRDLKTNREVTAAEMTGEWQYSYSDPIKELKIDPKLQYVEIGAGLGAWVSHVLAHQNSSSPRMMVIDPADYQAMKTELELALKDKKIDAARTSDLIRRCEMVLNPSKVIFFNQDLKTALLRSADLHQVADVVVDHFGPFHYAENSGADNLGDTLEKELLILKPGGKLFTSFARNKEDYTAVTTKPSRTSREEW